MAEPQIVVYGTYWCPDCKRAKKFFGEQRVQYKSVDIERDDAAREYVEKINRGKRIVPTIVFPDGSILVEPSNAELAAKLGLNTKAQDEFYDLIVIGGGVAGLTAALYAAREGIETLIIEKSSVGGQAGLTENIANYPGFPDGISGAELAERFALQARRFGVEILQAMEVKQLMLKEPFRVVVTGDGMQYCAHAVLITTGADYRRLNVRGEDDFMGAGIHFCATCDGPFYKGAEELVVVGGGNSAVEEGVFLAKFAKKVTLLVRGDALKASRTAQDEVEGNSQIEVRYNTVVQEFRGNGKLDTVVIENQKNGRVEELHPAGAFVFIGLTPNSAQFKGLVELDAYGFIRTGHDLLHVTDLTKYSTEWLVRHPFDMETCRPGIFAAGDVRAGATAQIASASGEGASAALAIRDYLKLK